MPFLLVPPGTRNGSWATALDLVEGRGLCCWRKCRGHCACLPTARACSPAHPVGPGPLPGPSRGSHLPWPGCCPSGAAGQHPQPHDCPPDDFPGHLHPTRKHPLSQRPSRVVDGQVSNEHSTLPTHRGHLVPLNPGPTSLKSARRPRLCHAPALVHTPWPGSLLAGCGRPQKGSVSSGPPLGDSHHRRAEAGMG